MNQLGSEYQQIAKKEGAKFGPNLRTASERKDSRVRERRIEIPSTSCSAAKGEGQVSAPVSGPRSLNQQIEFLLEEALAGAAKKPQNDQPGDKGSPGKS